MIREKATISCTSCSYSPLPYYSGRAETIVCPSCGKELLISMGQSFLSRTPKASYQSEKYTIPLGTVLEINKVQYSVTGVALMRESGKTYSWTEYTLFNDALGFKTLSEYENTFMLVERFEPEQAEEIASELLLGKTAYKLYNHYKIRVMYAAGEFSYHPSEIHGVSVREYLFLHRLVIVKKLPEPGLPNRKEYYRASYVSKKTIEKVLGKYLVSSNYTNPTSHYIKAFTPREAFYGYAGFLVLMILSLLLFKGLRPETRVWTLQETLHTDSVSRSQPLVSPSFKIDETYTALRFDFDTDLNNNWIELAFNLVNEGNNKSYAFNSGTERYSGIDWSEGSLSNYATLSGIPAGTYHIAMLPVFNTGSPPVWLRLEVNKNHLYLRNYILFAVLAGLFPLVYYIMERALDRNRWYFSDHSPYTYNDDE